MHPVRSTTTAAILITLTFYASADDSATPVPPTGLVDVTISESVEHHRHARDLAKTCRSSYEVKGCTDFPAEHLACECDLHAGLWTINARADVQAVIHVSKDYASQPILRHERLHLTDLEDALREHLGRIASNTYESETACRTYARVLSDSPHLRVVMNKIRVKSNEKYGCSSGESY